MSLAQNQAYDLGAVIFGGADSPAEETDYCAAALPSPVRVSAIWGTAEPIDAGYGVVAYQRSVFFSRAVCLDGFGAAVVPVNAGWLIRRPDEGISGTDERWDVVSVGIEVGVYSLRVQRGA